MPGPRTRFARIAAASGFLVPAAAVAFAFPPAEAPAGVPAAVRDAAARARSFRSLKEIALALHAYGDARGGEFPPAAVVDRTGRPLLSWRVLVLPYLGHDALYRRFKLDEA